MIKKTTKIIRKTLDLNNIVKKFVDHKIFNKKDKHNINQKSKTMAVYNYGVGGNEVKVDANEAIQNIQENRTLLVSQLTSEEPFVPEVVKGLKTIEDIFRHFEPSVSVQHQTEEGTTVDEEFRFQNLGDFTPKTLTQKSDYLKQLSIEQEQYNKILRQLKNNKILKKIVENEQTKEALIDVLREIAQELEQK